MRNQLSDKIIFYCLFICLVVLLIGFISICYAGDYYSESNKIKNQKRETMIVIYYKDGEKINTDYIEGEKIKVNFNSNSILKEARNIRPDKIVLIHNHPSGNSNPSEKDLITAERMKMKFEKIGVKTENIIITSHRERRY